MAATMWGELRDERGECIGMVTCDQAEWEAGLHTPGEDCVCEPQCSPMEGRDRLGVMVSHRRLEEVA